MPDLVRVLLVDDDQMVSRALAAQPEARGFTVVQATSALTALVRLHAGDVPALLIADFAMPGMRGPALIDAARRLRPPLPAILLTGYADPEVQAAATRTEGNAIRPLRKPIAGKDPARQASVLLCRPAPC